MLYCSWDMAHDRCSFYYSLWAIFCPVTHLTAQKMKTSKKWNKHPEISPFNTKVPKIMTICFPVPEIWHVRCNYFSLWAIFCPFTPPPPTPCLTAWKMKVPKKCKNSSRYHHLSFYTCVPKIIIRWCTVPEIWCTTDRRWTDGRTEKVTSRGGYTT